jgi:hypothetical protein
MRISRRKHNAKALAGLGRESVLISGVSSVVLIGDGVRLYCDENRLERDPPSRYFVDLTDAEIRAIVKELG